jgi:hypothetical protein
MLNLAVKAGLPLIAVRTRDVVNAPAVIRYLTGVYPKEVIDPSKNLALGADKLFYTTWAEAVTPRGTYIQLAKVGSTLIILNPEEHAPEFFDAGVMPIPPGFVRQELVGIGIDKDAVERTLPVLGGLTMKEIGEAVRLCQVDHGGLSPGAMIQVRRRCFSQVRGLQLVDTHMAFYQPDPSVQLYLEWAGKYLLGNHDWRLRPRGLLLSGEPGTGKTSAAKHVASVIGLPLFRLDLGAVKGKWVGESEHALHDALEQVKREAPCVLLVDEVEKLFGRRSDEGTTENLLASLLWFLEEHRSRVLTIMTTNDAGSLPFELYREGRVDQCLTLRGLLVDAAYPFAESLIRTFVDIREDAEKRMKLELDVQVHFEGLDSYERVTQATITNEVKRLVRAWL